MLFLQMFEMSKLCEELVKEHEEHQNTVAECVRESRKVESTALHCSCITLCCIRGQPPHRIVVLCHVVILCCVILHM